MENVILIFVLTAILGGAVAYIVVARKRGAKCIGCPAGGTCGQKKDSALMGGCGSCGGCTSCECSCSSNGDDMQECCSGHEEMKQ